VSEIPSPVVQSHESARHHGLQSVRRKPIAGRRYVGVEVESGRQAAVVETARHDRDGHTSEQHLGCHEMSKVVQSKWSQSGSDEVTLKGFPHPIWFPCGAIGVGEYEAIPVES
jgi:hypothetical protein